MGGSFLEPLSKTRQRLVNLNYVLRPYFPFRDLFLYYFCEGISVVFVFGVFGFLEKRMLY